MVYLNLSRKTGRLAQVHMITTTRLTPDGPDMLGFYTLARGVRKTGDSAGAAALVDYLIDLDIPEIRECLDYVPMRLIYGETIDLRDRPLLSPATESRPST